MTEKGRIALIFGAVGLVAGGALFYVFKIHGPNKQRAAAQAEITTWESRLDAARTCLLGAAPVGDSAQALAVREMTPDPWDRGTCTKLIGKLSRGAAEDTGMMPVEHAWMSIDRAASKVATAFLDHVAPKASDPFERRTKASPLPAALLELDAAHAELRKAAGMEPPRTATQEALPAVELTILAHGDQRVQTLDAWRPPSAGGITAFGSTGSRQVQLVLAPGVAPKVVPVPNDAVRALPDLSWGAVSLFEELTFAPIDESGAFGAMTTLTTGTAGRVLGAVGTFTQGLAVVRTPGGFVVASSRGGPFTAGPATPASSVASANDLDGRLFVAWDGTGDDTGKLEAILTKGDALPVPVEIGSGIATDACLTLGGGWVGSSGQVISFDGTAARSHLLPSFHLVGCGKTAALLASSDSHQYAVCTDTCRMVNLPNLTGRNIATLVGDKVHAIRERNGVIGVWRENAPTAYFAAKQGLTPILATSDGKVIDVLATTDDGVALVRLPL